MKLGDIEHQNLARRLGQEGVQLKIGPFSVCLSSTLQEVASGLMTLYRDYSLVSSEDFIDFRISLTPPNLLRNKFRPQVCFYLDGHTPFKPLPQNQAFAMFEWGLNWCIANSAHQYLNIHAAVVEKAGHVLIMPGSPGSGKSTLCAAMTLGGWRLLSDEMALASIEDGRIFPVPRPISLKNKSIDIIRGLSKDVTLTKPVRDTAKGTVAHLRPFKDSIEQGELPAMPKLIVFPKYSQGSATVISPLSKGQALLKIAENSFNYNILGKKGFESLVELIDKSACFELAYENMGEAISHIDRVFDA